MENGTKRHNVRGTIMKLSDERLAELKELCQDPTGERHKTEYGERYMWELIQHIEAISSKKAPQEIELRHELYWLALDGLNDDPCSALKSILERLNDHRPEMASYKTQFRYIFD